MMHLYLSVLYDFSLEPIYALPLIYFASYFVCRLLREFSHGWFRYFLAVITMSSFAILWYVLLLDYTPWQYIMVGVIIVGAAAGLWRFIGDFYKATRKLG